METSKINVALRAVIETIENSKTERGKEEREKEKSLVLFYFFLFFNWVRCIPLAPRRGGRVAKESQLPPLLGPNSSNMGPAIGLGNWAIEQLSIEDLEIQDWHKPKAPTI
jgi:hypothetical protein